MPGFNFLRFYANVLILCVFMRHKLYKLLQRRRN